MHSLIYSHIDKKGQGGFNCTEITGRKRVKSPRLRNIHHRTVFALLWANFSPAASQHISVQTALRERWERNAKAIAGLSCASFSRQRIAILNPKRGQAPNPAK